MFDRTNTIPFAVSASPGLTRRQALAAAGLGLGSFCAPRILYGSEVAETDPYRDDLAIGAETALLFCTQAPLAPAAGLRDARAVWCHVPARPDRGVLIFLHGHNGYVTVDAKGRSRVPDWAVATEAARAGAAAKQAAPLVYGLDRLDSRKIAKAPIVIVPEVSTLATGSFWAKEPAGQYADPAKLGLLVADCWRHLRSLKSAGGAPYLGDSFFNQTRPGGRAVPMLDRVYLCGHSGAGLPIEEAARSALITPEAGCPADLWLFDSTYWSKVDGFVTFCERWKRAGRLAAGRRDGARFVCIYRPHTQTEEVADALRAEIAKVIGVDAASLVKDHSAENFDSDVRPALKNSGVLFVRTDLPHDDIPTFFIPALLETAAN